MKIVVVVVVVVCTLNILLPHLIPNLPYSLRDLLLLHDLVNIISELQPSYLPRLLI